MKREPTTLTIGIGARPEGDPVSQELNAAEQADTEMFQSMAPTGDFTSRGLDPLVKATNKLLPLFDQTPDYPMVEDTDVLPEDFVRILSMFIAAIDEAIAAGAIEPEMAISLDEVRDDTGLMTIAGKLDMLSKDKDFKRFINEAEAPEEEAPVEEAPPEQMSADEEDDLLMSRM